MKNTGNHNSSLAGNQSGMALVMVLVLSAIGLGLMTALIYMVTSGVQVSGMQKRYKTALEAGMGGKDIVIQVLNQKDHFTNIDTILNSTLPGAGILTSRTTPTACTGTFAGVVYTGLEAKLMTSTETWANCGDISTAITPTNTNSYDMSFVIGTNPQYTVYAKIADTIAGSPVGGEETMRGAGVVNTQGDIAVGGVASLYTVDVLTQNSADPREKSMLQVLYQY